MEYRKLGGSGLRVSELSLGAWITFGAQLDLDTARRCIRAAFEAGVNFFDNAEAYGRGIAESMMGEIIKEYRREELVISTKLFWGGKAPNQTSLTRKHLMEGLRNSLQRLRQDYVDLLFCHRPDPDTPIEETVLAMDSIVRSGRAFYWGTSEWPAEAIEEAFRFAREYHCIPPVMEQPQYNMIFRSRVEREYAPLYERYGLGLTTWSPLASGVLSGKYASGIPEGSRLAQVAWLREDMESGNLLGEPMRVMLEHLAAIARELDCTLAQLALAWCLKNPRVSSVITGASRVEQVRENMRAAEVKQRLNDEIMGRIGEAIGAFYR